MGVEYQVTFDYVTFLAIPLLNLVSLIGCRFADNHFCTCGSRLYSYVSVGYPYVRIRMYA